MKVKIEKKIEQIAQIIGKHKTIDGALFTDKLGAVSYILFLNNQILNLRAMFSNE